MKTSRTFFSLMFLALTFVTAQAQYHTVQSNDLEVNYRIFGEGKPLLIIGGGPGDNSNRYLSLCDLLSKKYQCILVDQRGTGKSRPERLDSTTVSIDLTLSDFEAIRMKLGLEQWNVLGFSYGGYLASIYTALHPSSISSLILLESIGLNTSAFGFFLDNITSRMHDADKALLEYWQDSARVAQDPKHAIVEQIRARMPGYFYDRKKSFIISQNMKDSDFDFDMGRWIWTDIFQRNLDLTKMESSFENPVLIVHGRQDPVGESVPQELSAYYKKSELNFVERAGHYVWIEQPEKVSELIGAFMDN